MGQADELPGHLISSARRAAGLSQQTMAERAGVSQSMIATYENGRRQPSLATLRKLLRAADATLHLELRTGVAEDHLPYSPMTIDDLAEQLTGSGNERRWLLVAEFLTEFGFEPAGTRFRLLGDRPRMTGDPRWDALLAALAEHLAWHDNAPIPAWVEEPDRFLDRWWFPTNTPAARAEAIVHAPASFMRRGVFVERRSLERA